VFNTFTDTTKTTATFNNNIDGLLEEYRWMSKSVSYSFTDSFSNDYESGYAGASIHSSSFKTLNGTQRLGIRNWAKSYSSVSGLNLSELTGASDRDATIRIAISNAPNTAYTYSPGDPTEAGDIFFNPRDYNTPAIGNYAYYTFAHELGHSLGLKHTHEAGGVRNVAMNADRDSMEFSVMSYRSYIGAPLTGATNETWGYAQSLMMYDIRAIQQSYGANFDTNANNTTYTFSTTTGEMFVNGVGQGTPGANRIFRTIWDGNGTDTYNLSNYTTNLSLDLTSGGWSDFNVGGNSQRADLGNGHYARGHVFNALRYNNDARSLIENAYGGSGNDRMIGNSADNRLIGNGGDDYILGGNGQDYLDGGNGRDNLDGGDGIDILTGGTGNDILMGGLGADRFQFNSKTEGVDTIRDFAADDKIGILATSFGCGLVAGMAMTANRLLTVNSGWAATNTNQRFIYNSVNGGLYFDCDGSGAGAAVQLATLSSRPALTATNFAIV
jgi:serralysin